MTEGAEKTPFVLRLEREMERNDIPDRATLARQIDAPYHRVNPWWQRGGKPNASDLLAVAKLLNVSETYLLDGGERRPFSPMAALLQRAESLPPEDQDDLESYLAYLEARTARRKSEKE